MSAAESGRWDRLGVGDRLNGLASLALAVDLFALPWYGYRAAFRGAVAHSGGSAAAALGPYRASGWQTFSVLGPLALVVCLLGLAACWLYLSRPSPVLPMAVTVVQAPLAGALVVGLLIRVLLAPPSVRLAGPGGGNALGALPGAYIGLALGLTVAVGVYLSLRREGVAEADSPAEIEVVEV